MPKHISLEGTFLNSNHNIENYHLKMSGITRVAIIRDLVNKSCFPEDTLYSDQHMPFPELGFIVCYVLELLRTVCRNARILPHVP